MARAKVNYTLPAKNLRTLVYWANGGSLFDGQGKLTAGQRKEN